MQLSDKPGSVSLQRYTRFNASVIYPDAVSPRHSSSSIALMYRPTLQRIAQCRRKATTKHKLQRAAVNRRYTRTFNA